MSPTIFRIGRYRAFFFSREETRMHVHISSPDGEAKFWLEPVALADSRGFRGHELTEICQMVAENQQFFLEEWHEYFG